MALPSSGETKWQDAEWTFEEDCVRATIHRFTPHIINVGVGEDIKAKLASFSHEGPRCLCILSAIGYVDTVTVGGVHATAPLICRKPTLIVRLSGSFMKFDYYDGKVLESGSITITLGGTDSHLIGGEISDSHLIGGEITGCCIAASPVQVIVGYYFYGRLRQPQLNTQDEAGSGCRHESSAPSSSSSRGFTHHTIKVEAGEDITIKMKSLTEEGRRSVSILSASGFLSSAVIVLSATSLATTMLEGHLEIHSLSGQYVGTENGGCNGDMSVALSTPNGIVCGRVAGILVSSSVVQVTCLTFVHE